MSDYTPSPYAAIGNGRVHYSTTSALPPALLSAARHSRDVESLPAFHDRRDLLSSTTYERRPVVADPAVEIPPSSLQFIHTLGRGLFGDVSHISPYLIDVTIYHILFSKFSAIKRVFLVQIFHLKLLLPCSVQICYFVCASF